MGDNMKKENSNKKPNRSRAAGFFKPQTGNGEIAAELRGFKPSLSNNDESKSKILVKNKELDVLEDFTKEQLISTIKKAINKNDSFKQEILELVNKDKDNFKKINEDRNNYSEYDALWYEAEPIINSFNELGGGDEDDEAIVYDNLDKIVQLFQSEKLDEETKIEFIDNCFECYFWGNSGFDDLLRDSAFEVCNSKENWQLVIEKLKRSNSDYDADCIIGIYKDKLNDDETYLKLRMADLYFGGDYYDLVEYYHKKNKIEKAVEIAKEGIEKGKGRISDLVEFLLVFYIKNKDYENSLKYYTLSFNEGPSLEKYNEIKRFCKNDDFDKISKKLYESINDGRSKEVKAEIDFINGDYQLVFNYVKENESGIFYGERLKNWTQKLEPHFPKDILKMYLKKIMHILEYKISKEYSVAEYYLRRIKEIYLEIINNKKEWDDLIYSLKQKSIKLPSFQKILQGLEEKR